jgi:multidrug efflux pump subunit AcrA (membrane-fusion protein)
MSALPHLPPADPGPRSPFLQTPDLPKRPRRWPIYAVLLTLLAVAAAWYLQPHRKNPQANARVRTVKAVRGALTPTRRIAGSINAERFSTITAPILQAPDTGRSMTLTFIAESGSHVNEGDLLAEIDSQDMKDHLDDVEAMLVQAQLEIDKRKSIHLAQTEYLRQRLRVTKAEWEKTKQDMRALEVKNALTQESIKLSVEEAQAAFEQISQEIPLTAERQQADLAGYVLEYERQLRHLNRHRHDVDRTHIKSPMSGMVLLQTTSRNGQLNTIRLGDTVQPGQPFIRIVDPHSMQLEGTMNQAESELVRLGQSATVHFDAFPDIVLSGRVTSLGTLAIGGRRFNAYIRRVPVRVTLENAGDRVIPDLSASADIVTAESSEGILVPREAVSESAGKSVVYVKQDGTFSPHEVAIGGANNTQFSVVSGLQEGQEIAVQPLAIIYQ